METTEILREFLSSNKLMQLATQSDKGLWVCNVYYAEDEAGKIYWTSGRSRRHSVEIEANSSVAATIVHDEETKRAVQMSGTARRLSIEESQAAHDLYGAKLGQKDERMDEVREDTPSSRAYWVFEPDFIELWDELTFPDKPKQRVA